MNKSLSIIFGIVILISCQNENNFEVSEIPEISLTSLQFINSDATTTYQDSLILMIKFTDGDNNLGLMPYDIDSPYHKLQFFYLRNGQLLPTQFYDNPDLIKINDIVTLPPFNCIDYAVVQSDTLYVKRNSYYYNIVVNFLVLENGEYVNFVFENTSDLWCTENFNTRFAPPTPLNHRDLDADKALIIAKMTDTFSGELKYNMVTAGFFPWFGGKTIKLRIQIFDRALNASNWIESEPIKIQ